MDEHFQQEILPLKRTWNLWFDSPHLHKNYKNYLDASSWKKSLNHVYDINSIQTFWQTYNNIMSPSEMWYKSAYYLFAEGCYPSDMSHFDRPLISFIIPEDLDQDNSWLYIILSVIGEHIPYNHDVYGISFIKHKKYGELILWVDIYDKTNIEIIIQHCIEMLKKKDILIFINYFALSPYNKPSKLTSTFRRS